MFMNTPREDRAVRLPPSLGSRLHKGAKRPISCPSSIRWCSRTLNSAIFPKWPSGDETERDYVSSYQEQLLISLSRFKNSDAELFVWTIAPGNCQRRKLYDGRLIERTASCLRLPNSFICSCHTNRTAWVRDSQASGLQVPNLNQKSPL